jgi:two-component system sensor histidine kinase/response regulator
MKDDLMKMIVHDLKSPLAGILGTLEMVIDGDLGPLTPEQRRMLSEAQQRGDDAVQLIEDLLELAHLEESSVTLELSELNARDFLRSVADEWRVRVERRGATLAVDQVEPLPFTGDRHLLRRVFSNLIGNALRHAGDALRIGLSATAPAEGDGVTFTVADDGVGIAPAYHDFIFRKFGSIRQDGGRPTSGLGLTFCKLAVEAHGGRIWVESPEGEGARFHFMIPHAPRPARPAAA